MREIRDPNSGARWVVIGNLENSAGPGRLMPAEDAAPARRGDFAAETKPLLPVIHRGDRVVVEEHTATVEAYLEAIAMEPATTGSSFAVRLKIGGKVVKALLA